MKDSTKDVISRLTKLKMERNFYNINGGKFIITKLIYTTEFTCEHTAFDFIEKNVYQCRECTGMIFLNQINQN